MTVYPSSPPYIGYPCTKPVKIEIEGRSYCAIHDPEAYKRRKEKRRLKWNEDNEKRRQQYAAQDEVVRRAACYEDLMATLQKIAEADDPYEPCGWAINAAKAAIKKATQP